jgi:hypothetical protein
MAELNPDGTPFDRVIFRSFRPLGDDWISFDKIALAEESGPSFVASVASNPPASTVPPLAVAPSAPGGPHVRMRITCDAKATKISPFIYGIAYGDPGWETLGATVRRWGGNAATRYNWETHFNNRARDWFFENHPGSSYAEFVQSSAAHSALSALTVPTIGWVAKDGTSFSFPVSVYGPQGKTDQWNPDAGNGVTTAGVNIEPGPPNRTSTEAPPEWIKRWVSTVRESEAKDGKRNVYEYILDNEPMLWHDTHRDVHPAPVGYDELLDRTIRYGSAVRTADPDAVIAGPAEWGWPAYFDSAKDLAGRPPSHADRRAHGDVPLVEWYLRKAREHEQKTHTRVLDVLDLHYYPQAANVFSGAGDKETQLLRLRSTRSLWDPAYIDESWIKESIRLLPRMREWVEKNYPGRGISIGEWNFGGEQDITGALAIAEALGRFAQFGVTSAFYWTAPPHGSPGSFGFLAYRNFDGKGGQFLDWFVPAASSNDVSLFASRDAEGKHLVVIAINMSRDAPVLADLDVNTCGTVASQQAYQYARGAQGFEASGSASPTALAPWSITAIDIRLR